MKKTTLILISLFVTMVSLVHAQTANWSAVSPAKFPTNVSGQIHGISRVSQLKFHPTNANKMYAISARGGLFITSDGGSNWSVAPGTDFMPYQRLASVCVDFTNDQIIYLGTGDHDYYYNGTGVWKSTNGGQTFTQTTLNNLMIVEMIMDPNNHNIIVAATNAGIYKTTDAGATWTLKSTSRPFDDLQRKAGTTSRTLFASTTDTAFYRSTNFGDTWTQISTGITLPSGVTTGGGCRVAVTPADSNVVYLGMVASGGIIYKSTDGGTSFSLMKTSGAPYVTYYTNLSTDVGQGDYNFGIGADRVNANIVYLVAHCVWKSTDGGANWTQMTNWWASVHTDMHQTINSPYNNNQLWNMNDGGVWLSTDGGTTWTPKSDGIYGYEIYHGNCSPTRKDMISIGTQDNGELFSTSAGWFTNRGGDWFDNCIFDYRPSSTMVYYYGNNSRRIVSGNDATYGFPGGVVTNLAFNRTNINLGFACDSNVYRTTNLINTTPSWTKIFALSKKVMAVHSSLADSNRLYVITNDAKIYVSTNALSALPTFTMYTLPNATSSLANITTIKSNSSVIYVTCNTKVYKSANNGVSWTDITYNLPSVNHIGLVSDEYFSSTELVFIGSNNSVYYKKASDITWTLFSTNLPSRTTLNDLSIYNDGTANTSLRTSTYGRGMWQTPINNLEPLTANLSVDRNNLCIDTIAHFSDISTGTVTSRLWSFPGGTPSTSTAQNPSVYYHNTGVYPVTLSVSDGTNNASITQTNYISTMGLSLPIAQGIEGSFPPSGWTIVDNTNDGNVWGQASGTGGYGTSSSSLVYNNYNINAPGVKDEFRSSTVNLVGYTTATLTFDIAYAYYGVPYSDTMAVLISTDCGSTFTRVYFKGGSKLSTISSVDPFTPTATQWRNDTINLNAYLGYSIMVSFQNINYYGNNLYIDNIKINGTIISNAGLDKTICKGTTTQLGSSPVNGVTYSWTPSIGLSSTTISNPIDTGITTTTYVLTTTQTQSGITNKDTILVTVLPLPAQAGVISGPLSVNLNQNNVTYTVPAINNANTYTWTLPVGFTGASTTNSITVNVSSNALSGNISVKGHNNCGDGLVFTINVNVNTNKHLYATAMFQEYYNNSTGLMNPTKGINWDTGDLYNNFGDTIVDTLRVLIRKTNVNDQVNPCTIDTVLFGQSININGLITPIVIPSSLAGYHYIEIKHRNSIETWSDSVDFSTDTVRYDFYNYISQFALDGGMYLNNNHAFIWGGDVNQNGNLESADATNIYVAANSDDPTVNNGYVICDIDGNGNLDSQDYGLAYNNANLGANIINPFSYLKKK